MSVQLLQLAISLAGVALMIGLCRALFGGRTTTLTGDDAVRSLAHDVAGFRPARIALSRDGRAALAEDARDGAVYLALARGDGVVTRKLAHGIGVARDGARLTLRLDEFTLKSASLDLADAAAWQARLAA